MPQYLSSSKRTVLQQTDSLPENARSALPSPAGPIEIGVVCDRSGSMKHLREAALTGFNTLLAEQQKLAFPTRFSLSFFSDEVSLVHDGVPITDIGVMEDNDYLPYGSTALLDGIGSMIERIAERTDPKPYPSRVLIAILSDGEENSSVRFSKEEIFEAISFRRASSDWQFLFMGAKGSQTISTGLSLGIQRSNIVEFGTSPESLSKLMLALSGALKAYQLGNKNFMFLLKSENS